MPSECFLFIDVLFVVTTAVSSTDVELNFVFISNRSISELNTKTINRQSISNYSINLLKSS